MAGSLRRRGDEWMVDIRIGGRRVRKLVGKSRRLAEQVLRRYQDEKVRAEHGLPAWTGEKAPTLDTYVEEHLAALRVSGVSPLTVAAREGFLRHVRKRFGQSRLSEIHREGVQAFIRDQLEAGYSPSTVQQEVAALRRVLRVAAEDGRIPGLPSFGPVPRARTRDRFLSEDEVGRLLVALRPSPELERFAWIVLLTGLRVREALSLQWQDIDRERGLLVVRTKGGKRRAKPVHRELLDRLEPPRRGPAAATVLPWHDRELEDARRWYGRRLKALAAAAGIPGVTPNVLRHTFSSHLGMRGADAATLRDAMGHASIATTDAYTHTVAEHVRAAIDRLPWATGAPGGHHLRPADEEA